MGDKIPSILVEGALGNHRIFPSLSGAAAPALDLAPVGTAKTEIYGGYARLRR